MTTDHRPIIGSALVGDPFRETFEFESCGKGFIGRVNLELRARLSRAFNHQDQTGQATPAPVRRQFKLFRTRQRA